MKLMRGELMAGVAVAIAISGFGQLVVNRPTSGHRYYYRESFLIPSQPWDGTPFVVEADLVPPTKDFSPNSWFGLCVDDTLNRERYIFGAGNATRRPDPGEFALAAVKYARKPCSIGWCRDRVWSADEKTLTVRVSWDGSRPGIRIYEPRR